MSNDNTRLTDYETKEKLDKLKEKEKADPLEPQWDYDKPVPMSMGNPVSSKTVGEVGAHWPECWRVHHECAVNEIERLHGSITE